MAGERVSDSLEEQMINGCTGYLKELLLELMRCENYFP